MIVEEELHRLHHGCF